MINRVNFIIEEKREFFKEISNKIWGYAETRFEEFKSSSLLSDVLQEEGFKIEKNIGDMATAFIASYGKGKPVIAVLGEFDALAGLSQKSDLCKKEPLIEGENGHGCGHNILGTASLAAVIAVKKYMEENNIQGTIRYYGCPGEEGGSGKTYMVRDGAFDDVDIALAWHPWTISSIKSVSSLANYQVYFRFKGRSSHAASSPHLGRSALDAVELMNVGANYLREHIIPQVRIHYAITNTGGVSPNVVQANAEVLYLIRAPKVSQVDSVYKRIVNIAKGAALMTETEVDIIFDKGCSNYVPNKVVEDVMFKYLKLLGGPKFKEEDLKFAKSIKSTLSNEDIEASLALSRKIVGNENKSLVEELKNEDLCKNILPFEHNAGVIFGSTDVGDVSWVVPTAELIVACAAIGTPGHSWQIVSQGSTGIAHEGMLLAAKVIALAALEIFKNPELVKEAKKELKEKLQGEQYKCPIPKYIKPSLKR